jgi:hypothetical protein
MRFYTALLALDALATNLRFVPANCCLPLYSAVMDRVESFLADILARVSVLRPETLRIFDDSLCCQYLSLDGCEMVSVPPEVPEVYHGPVMAAATRQKR